MALCAFSFPGIINRAAASDPQKSTPFTSHLLGGTHLLFQPLHKLNQVCIVKMEVNLSMWRENLGFVHFCQILNLFFVFFTKFKVFNFILFTGFSLVFHVGRVHQDIPFLHFVLSIPCFGFSHFDLKFS